MPSLVRPPPSLTTKKLSRPRHKPDSTHKTHIQMIFQPIMACKLLLLAIATFSLTEESKMPVGTSPERVDAQAKVTGRARYTDDMTMPGMRHAKYVRSPIAHGLVTRIDTSKALQLPGVEAIFTYQDVPQHGFPTAGHAWSLDANKRDVADKQLLTQHVRHHGDGVAIVVARDVLTAEKAAMLVEVGISGTASDDHS
ncbi:4-hydroxybenzoyl-CoA reductase subunit alpha [Serratia fonticola]|uniref:4-hydroxybenzoyl-CoA reductase subunit alpha n=1 Tax=Serratia fonticola TaxID=47917 RepID=A0A4U9UM91_SERFO|nr:4-hydroxybenzoyl-CoA reductase subunit alpha [Serratia fonticola]